MENNSQIQAIISKLNTKTSQQQIKVFCLNLLVDYMNFENKRPLGSTERFDFDNWWENNKNNL